MLFDALAVNCSLTQTVYPLETDVADWNDVKQAFYGLVVRCLEVLADHVPSLGLFGLSILLHRLRHQLVSSSEVFNGFVDFVIYAFFILGFVRALKWILIDLAKRGQQHRNGGESSE